MTRRLQILALSWLLLAGAAGAASESAPTTHSAHFTLEGVEPRSRLAVSLLMMAERSYADLEKRLPPHMPRGVRLIWIAKPTEFATTIGDRSPDIMAVALSGRPVIVFNGLRVSQGPISDMGKTFTHELVHVYLSQQAAGEIPLWVHEGLATNLAFQDEYEPTAGFQFQHLLGRLPRLAELERKFPRTPAARATAYRCSYLALRHLRETEGLYSFMANLRDPRFVRGLYAPEFRYAVDQGYRKRYLSHIQLLFYLTSGNVLWVGMTLLFLVAYFRKRRRVKVLLLEMERAPYDTYPGYDDPAADDDEHELDDYIVDDDWRD